MKRNFVHHKKKKRHGKSFWDTEYANAGHLQLSEEASEDLEKFVRFLVRTTGKTSLNPTSSMVDFGCGNGRNLIYLARDFGLHGIGYDISDTAVKQARTLAEGLQLTFAARSMAGTFPDLPDESQTLALDMMASHFLNPSERKVLRDEIFRVLKPGGWLFMKTFLRDGDLHTKRLLSEHGTDEDGTYIHPVIGEREHTYWEADLVEFLEEKFQLHKVYRSHKHISRGKANKRRTISIYAQKPEF